MRNLLFCFLVFLLLGNVFCRKSIDIEEEKNSVREVLEESLSSTEDEDMERLAKTFAQDEDLLFIDLSTDKDTLGWSNLRAMFENQFEKYSNVDFNQTSLTIKISTCRQFAWAVYFCDFTAMRGKEPVYQPGRITYIFEKRDNKWIIIHFHYSVGRDS